ncbi:hypothetical protein LCGC14_1951960, partial [marine sediment metagenome]
MGFFDKIKKALKKVKETAKKVFKKPAEAPAPKATAPKKETPFEKRAKEVRVDLPAEKARAEQQIKAGKKIEGRAAPLPTAAPQPKKDITVPEITVPEGGWKNVKEVFKVSLNPFSEDKIVATTENKVFNSVAEFVANHPYTVALAAAGGIGIVRGVVTRLGFGVGKIGPAVIGKGDLGTALLKAGRVAPGVAGKYATNTATKKLTGNLFIKKGFTLIAAAYIIKEAVETYPFAKFEIAEAMDKIGYARAR